MDTGSMATTDEQKRERAKRTREFLDHLITRYPDCFTANAATIRPLAIGIQKTIRTDLEQDPAMTDTPGWLVRQALALYTRSPSYLEATLAGKARVNLDGSDAGEITTEALEFAQTRRDEQKQRLAERRKQAAQAKRRKKEAADAAATAARNAAAQDSEVQDSKTTPGDKPAARSRPSRPSRASRSARSARSAQPGKPAATDSKARDADGDQAKQPAPMDKATADELRARKLEQLAAKFNNH